MEIKLIESYGEVLCCFSDVYDCGYDNLRSVTYDSTTDAGISTEFSTVGYRLGHTMVSSNLQVGANIENTVALRDVFFTPSYIQTNGADNILIGAANKT